MGLAAIRLGEFAASDLGGRVLHFSEEEDLDPLAHHGDEAHDEPLDFILTEREWIAARSLS